MRTLIYENRQWWLDDLHKPSAYTPAGQFREISLQPYLVRDLTVSLEKKTEMEVLIDIVGQGGKYLEKVYKIDEFLPKKNITFRLIFQSFQRNLSAKEIDSLPILTTK